MAITRFASTLSTLVALASVAACHRAPDIAFGQYGPGYADKPDFAEVEFRHPLSVDNLQQLTPDNLKRFDQEQIDQIYARLTAGPIPDGPFDGDLVFPKGQSGDRRLAEIVGGMPGAVVQWKAINLEQLGRALWKGKVFYRDQRLLRNRIEDTRLLQPLVGSDMGSIPKTRVGNGEQWLLFPAKLYCGQSLLDGRRESVIIDYAYNDELPGYQEHPDALVGRNGLNIRDEIRMIRPGFYLGRAYANKVFLLNFMLYNSEVADAGKDGFARGDEVAEDCWPGEQQHAAN